MGIENFKQEPLNFDAPSFEDMNIDELRVLYSVLIGLPSRPTADEQVRIISVLNEQIGLGSDQARENELTRLRELDSADDKTDLSDTYRR